MGLPPEVRERQKQYWIEYIGSERFWNEVQADLAAGRHPHNVALSKALKSGKTPPDWALRYIAERFMDEEVNFGRGRPDWSDVGLTALELVEASKHHEIVRLGKDVLRTVYAREVRRRQRRYKSAKFKDRHLRWYRRTAGAGAFPPKVGALEQALQRVSKKTGVPAETLRQYVNPPRRKKVK